MAIIVDVTKESERSSIIEEIELYENRERRFESVVQTDIYADNLQPHVEEKLRSRNTDIKEIPVISSINLSRRVVKAEASIYKTAPEREFTNLTDQQREVVERIYADMDIDTKMMASNESFRLQLQNHLYILPVDGKLVMRVLRNHHLDKIDDDTDPEKAGGYVISAFDRSLYDRYQDTPTDGRNNKIGDAEDYRLMKKRFTWWTPEHNMVTNHRGMIQGDNPNDIDSPLKDFNIMPIVEVCVQKDFEYWLRQGNSLNQATIEFNTMMSEVNQIMRMQGFSQAYMITSDPENAADYTQMGPTYLIKMNMDPQGQKPEFGFATPGADLAGSITFLETFLSTFLTSRGLDASTISGKPQSDKFGSGVERLLAMLDKFEASRSDFAAYEKAEAGVYNVIKAWHNASLGNALLDAKYRTIELPEDSEVKVTFASPEMIKTDEEVVNLIGLKREEGLASRIDGIEKIYNLDREAAIDKARQIDQDEMELGNATESGPGNQESEAESEGNDSGAENGSEE